MTVKSGSRILHAMWASGGNRSLPKAYRQRGQNFFVQLAVSKKQGNNLQSGQMPLENVIHCTVHDLYRI